MLTIDIIGGLGNQLFQIFALISSSLKSNVPFYLPYYEYTSSGLTRPTYWNNFLKSLKQYTRQSKDENQYNRYNEPYFQYRQLPVINNLKYYGYFQSEKYFKDYYSTICKMIELDKTKESIYKEYGIKYLIKDQINISLHFRRGDYKNNPAHLVLDDKYYIQAIKYIIDKLGTSSKVINIVYFCEKEDIDSVNTSIKNISSQFNETMINFTKCDTEIEDWEQLILMSLFDHNVIANSTFSWWAAYFNSNPNKIITYPSSWFGAVLWHHNLADLFPNEWVKINSI